MAESPDTQSLTGGRVIRTRLRRRLLVTFLALSVIPSAILLAATIAASLGVMREMAMQSAESSVQVEAARLSDAFQKRAAALVALRDGDPPSNAPLAAYHLATGTPQPLTGSAQAAPDPPPVPWEDLLFLDPEAVPDGRTALLRSPAPPTVPSGAAFWIVAPLPSGEWIGTPVTANQIFTEGTLDLGPPSGNVRLFSAEEGLVDGLAIDPAFLPLVDAVGESDLAIPRLVDHPKDSNLAYAVREVSAVSALSRNAGKEIRLHTAELIDIGEGTTALVYSFWRVALAGLLLIAIAASLGIWFANRLVDPILKLRAGFLRLESGDLDYRVELQTGDELEGLALSMNNMAETLKETYRNLADKLVELDEKAKQLSVTHEVAHAINSSLDPDMLFANIIREIRKLVPADLIALGVISKDDQHRIRIGYTWPPETAHLPKGTEILTERSIAVEYLDVGELAVFDIEEEGKSAEEKLLRESGMVALCTIPLRTKSDLVGILYVADSIPGTFGTRQVGILQRLSATLSAAVDHSWLYAQQARFAEELERLVRERTQELETAQGQLLQSEKFAAAGELAANLAHEINNPLSIIKNYLKLLRNQLLHPIDSTMESEIAREGVGIIEEEIDRIARIVDQLRKVRSPQAPEWHPVNVNTEINNLVQLFRGTFQQRRIRIVTRLDERLGEVLLSGDFYRQIVINLLRNAIDAIDKGGEIEIETRRTGGSNEQFLTCIRDTGTGIPAEHLDKIFSPFFSTKKDGKGTGLGLSVSYGLAQQMGGRIEAANRHGRGAEFRIVLPLTFAANETPKDDQHVAPGVRREGQRIIIG